MKPARTPIRTGASRARRAPRIFALAALVAAPLVAVFATSPPTSATTIPQSVDFISGAATLKGGGYTWLVSVDALSAPGMFPTRVDIGLERSVAGGKGFEIHSWQFHAPTSSFVFSSKTGDATVNSGKSLEPVASVDVKFVVTKKAKEAGCATGSSATLYTGKLSGSLHLVTGTKPKNLTLSSKKVSFTTGTNMLTVGFCIPDLCSGAALWGEPAPTHSGAISASGLGEYVSSKKVNLTSVTRQTKLSAPKGATREDGAIVSAPPVKWSAKTKTLSVSGSSSASGIVTGSGKLIGHAGKTSKSSCQISGKGKKYTEHTTVYTIAKLSAWKAFVAHTVLTGTLTASSKGGGFFAVVSLS